MLLTLTLNAAVDKTYRVEGFTLDRVHRPSQWWIVAGGKGINVARVYRTLGGDATATGFLGGYNGQFVRRSLAEEGMPGDFTETRDECRVCIAVVDPISDTQTEVNEVGPNVSAEELSDLRGRFTRLLKEEGVKCVTLSGSAPPGVPDKIYYDMIEDARACGVRAALDASGACLEWGVRARPWVVKPNIHELSALCGRSLTGEAEVVEAARNLLGTGIEMVAVTLGGEGAVLVTGSGAWAARPPEVEFVSAVGSGDSFLAAFLWALLDDGRDEAEALRLAVGAGAANAAVYGAGFCTRDAIMKTAEVVEIRPVRMGGV